MEHMKDALCLFNLELCDRVCLDGQLQRSSFDLVSVTSAGNGDEHNDVHGMDTSVVW